MRKIAILIFALMLAACGDESDAQKAVKSILKDPDSAKFGKTTLLKGADGKDYACVTVNAKNAMGGYVGDKQSVVIKLKDQWESLGTDDESHEQCIFVITAMSKK